MEDKMSKSLHPFINIGPGRIIKRNLDSLNWSQEDLAEIIGMSAKSVNLLINNKQSITVETAFLLAHAFGVSPEFWLNLDQNYRLRQKEEGARERETSIKAEIRKYMPILEMRKKGWIQCTKSTQSQVKAFCDFWGQHQPDFRVYETNRSPYFARQGKDDKPFTRYYTATWLQRAQQTATAIKSSEYNKQALRELSFRIAEFGLLENGLKKFLKDLGHAGVKFFVQSHLSKTYLDGACFYDGENPVVVYTGRYNRMDNFWFTLAHELAHILLHFSDHSECYIDNLDEREPGDEPEAQADALAGELLRAKILIDAAEPYKGYMSEIRLKQVSQFAGLNTSVALGILQYHGIVDYRTLNRFKQTVLEKIPGKYLKG
jgi:HTH-type transcriptional regulator / antitoxin HigA